MLELISKTPRLFIWDVMFIGGTTVDEDTFIWDVIFYWRNKNL